MAELDDASHHGIGLAPTEVLNWLLPKLDTDLGWRRWLDTEAIAFPGEPRRRCDTVAELVSRSGTQPPWALALEAEARSRQSMLDRALEYALRLMRRLRHGPHKRDRYRVAAFVLFLQGPKRKLSIKLRLPGTQLGLKAVVGSLALEAESAATTLARIERGELGRSILIWIPLMAGADDPAVVAQWVRLAKLEPDLQRQAEYAGLARVFVDWKGLQAIWGTVLEEWDVEQIPIVEKWKSKARSEGHKEGQVAAQRQSILHVLGVRFGVALPEDVAQAVGRESRPDTLAAWFDAALREPTLDAVRTRIKQP